MVSLGDAEQEGIIEKKSSTESLSNEERGVPHVSGDAEANSNEVAMIGLNKNEPSWLSRNHSFVRRLVFLLSLPSSLGGGSPLLSFMRPATDGSCRRYSHGPSSPSSPFGSSRIQLSRAPLKRSGIRSSTSRSSLSQNTSAIAWAGLLSLLL